MKVLLPIAAVVFLFGCQGTIEPGPTQSNNVNNDNNANNLNNGNNANNANNANNQNNLNNQNNQPDGGCVPMTCAELGFECGTAGDGCGGTMNCGTCTAPELCGFGGENLCGEPQDCGPAPAGASADQVTAHDAVNAMRVAMGADCMTMVTEINAAAQSHADYGVTNAGVANCASTGHDQTEGCPGFTGTNFSARMNAAGYNGQPSFEIAHFIGNPTAAIPGWLGTLWHRVPLVNPNSDHYGSGTAQGWDVMDFGSGQAPDPDGVWFYPYDGMTISGSGGNESPPPPDPPAGCAAQNWGTFVTIMFARSASVSIDAHSLTGPGGAVEYNWIQPGDSQFLQGSVYAMVPCRLEPGAYTVNVQGTVNGNAFDRSVVFTAQ